MLAIWTHTANFVDVLFYRDSFVITVDYGCQPQHWLMFDRIVQQIVTQTENGTNHDISIINIDVKEIVHL